MNNIGKIEAIKAFAKMSKALDDVRKVCNNSYFEIAKNYKNMGDKLKNGE